MQRTVCLAAILLSWGSAAVQGQPEAAPIAPFESLDGLKLGYDAANPASRMSLNAISAPADHRSRPERINQTAQ